MYWYPPPKKKKSSTVAFAPHLLLREHLDRVADDVDSARVRGVQLQYGVLVWGREGGREGGGSGVLLIVFSQAAGCMALIS